MGDSCVASTEPSVSPAVLTVGSELTTPPSSVTHMVPNHSSDKRRRPAGLTDEEADQDLRHHQALTLVLMILLNTSSSAAAAHHNHRAVRVLSKAADEVAKQLLATPLALNAENH